jgi:trimeric autotransporter adhesin
LQATAVGKNATAAFSGSTALGFAATTTRANQVVLGGAGSSVTIGSLASSTAAQNGQTFFATVDGTGTLGQGVATNSLATQAALNTTNANVASLQTATNANTASINSLQSLTAGQQAQITSLFSGLDKAYEGVAMGLAMESPSLPAGTNFGLSGGIGYFEKSTAGTMAFAARVGENASVSAGVGIGFDSGEVGARGGFQVAW